MRRTRRTSRFARFAPSRLAALIAMAALPMAAAAQPQAVFKCVVDGKPAYQATPCVSGQGKELEIKAGPTDEQVREAKARAEAEKSRAGGYQAPAAAPSRPMGDRALAPRRKPDCAQLNKQRADAFGRRNALYRDSRGFGIDRSPEVDREHSRIMDIERSMVSGGCQPD